jgi:hypothetical protein
MGRVKSLLVQSFNNIMVSLKVSFTCKRREQVCCDICVLYMEPTHAACGVEIGKRKGNGALHLAQVITASLALLFYSHRLLPSSTAC